MSGAGTSYKCLAMRFPVLLYLLACTETVGKSLGLLCSASGVEEHDDVRGILDEGDFCLALCLQTGQLYRSKVTNYSPLYAVRFHFPIFRNNSSPLMIVFMVHYSSVLRSMLYAVCGLL